MDYEYLHCCTNSGHFYSDNKCYDRQPVKTDLYLRGAVTCNLPSIAVDN